MRFDIQARGFELTPALRQHAERRLRFALARAEESVRKVSVRLSDVNGPRGGQDKQCHLRVALNHLSDVLIEDIEADLYAAIDRAADRAGRTVARRLARSREYPGAAADFGTSGSAVADQFASST